MSKKDDSKRKKLPYRKTSICFVLYANNLIVAKEMGTYIKFPGGGIDKGESIENGVYREL